MTGGGGIWLFTVWGGRSDLWGAEETRRNLTTGIMCSIEYHSSSVIFVNENENENYQKRKNNDSVNEN